MTDKEKFEKQIALKEALIRLEDNKDFQLLIIEGYLQDEALRTLQLSVSSSLNQEQRDNSLSLAQSTAHLQNYFRTVAIQGDIAKKNLDDYLANRYDEE